MRKNYSVILFLIILIISVSTAYGEETEGGNGNGNVLYEELARQAESISVVENPDKVISLLEPYKIQIIKAAFSSIT